LKLGFTKKGRKARSVAASLLIKNSRKTTQAVKPLPTSIEEKETHWPKDP